MFKVDLSKTDFTTETGFKNIISEAKEEIRKAEEDVKKMKEELNDYRIRGEKRLKQLEDWERDGDVKFTGEICKVGKGLKEMKIIMIFPDNTQRIYSKTSTKVEDLRDTAKRIKEKYPQCDWSAFDYKLR